MAKIDLQSSEIPVLINFIQTLVPGLNLDYINNVVMKQATIIGVTTYTKTINNQQFVVELNIK